MNPEQEQGFTYTGPQAPAPAQQPVDDPQTQASTPAPEKEVIQWQASEFVDHQKNANWFILLGLGALVLCGLVFLISRSIFSTVVILIAVIAFGMTANQKPRTLNYSLFATNLKVGDKAYSYEDFRSFSVVREGALWSVVLQPIKRFMPALTIYFAGEDGERIFDVLATHIPHEEHEPDAIDRLLRRIRF